MVKEVHAYFQWITNEPEAFMDAITSFESLDGKGKEALHEKWNVCNV